MRCYTSLETHIISLLFLLLFVTRADRVVVVAGDNASGDTLMPWLGSGFRALGAATTKAAIEDAALPFDQRRSGMLLGAGGIGMVLAPTGTGTDRRRHRGKLFLDGRRRFFPRKGVQQQALLLLLQSVKVLVVFAFLARP